MTLPAGQSRTFSAWDLESGGGDLQGALGDGAGKWQLEVASAQPIAAMGLLESPTGHLTNLSRRRLPAFAPGHRAWCFR